MTENLRMGLVGAGPWATVVHAPLIDGGPGTSLEVVWARRPDAAAELASPYGAAVAGSFEELLERCDAVAFAVPPDVQAALARQAAMAGKHLLLEKPLAFNLPDAERLAAAVEEAGVSTMMFLTNRFTAEVRDFLARVAQTACGGSTSRSTRSTRRSSPASPAGDGSTQVLDGIEAAVEAGLRVKINTVALKGVNDDEVHGLVAWCGDRGFDLTFIEVMPMGDLGRRGPAGAVLVAR